MPDCGLLEDGDDVLGVGDKLDRTEHGSLASQHLRLSAWSVYGKASDKAFDEYLPVLTLLTYLHCAVQDLFTQMQMRQEAQLVLG